MNYILKDENAIYYECGYSCDNAIFISLGSESFFLTDGRYAIDATINVKNALVVITSDLHKESIRIFKKNIVKKIIFDPKEWSIYEYNIIDSKTKTKFIPKVDFSHKKRIIKREDELNIIAKAAKLGTKAFGKMAKEFRQNGFGLNEFELTNMAKNILESRGSFDLSFSPIVAIGSNAAKPHATPTLDTLKKDSLLLVDAGLKYKRYCSDRTRTVQVGKYFMFDTVQHFKSKKIQKAYDTVLKAHDVAIGKARSGMKAKKIDSITRDIISKAGFGDYFVHSTGHGVGLDIHEMPYISKKSDTVIEDGMVYTIEPGIYIPDEFGIRIEDMVMMQNGKAVVL